MTYKYFGIINENEILSLDKDKRISFLLSKGLLSTSHRIVFNHLPEPDLQGKIEVVMELSKENMEYTFTKDIAYEVYKFLLQHYKLYLNADVVLFQREFESETYGLSDEKKRERGLKCFNNYFYEICDKEDQNIILNENKEKILELRFDTLSKKKNHLVRSLVYEIEIISQFLIGNETYYNKELFEHNKLIKDIFLFENNFQILQYLNNTFKFEKKDNQSNEIYKRYSDKINSLEVVEFIIKYLSNPIYKKRKFGLGIFYCLKNKLNLIQFSADEFKDLCNDYFDCNFKNLRLGHYGDSHKNHVTFFKKEWENFTTKP